MCTGDPRDIMCEVVKSQYRKVSFNPYKHPFNQDLRQSKPTCLMKPEVLEKFTEG